jgi:hypothetical protein
MYNRYERDANVGVINLCGVVNTVLRQITHMYGVARLKAEDACRRHCEIPINIHVKNRHERLDSIKDEALAGINYRYRQKLGTASATRRVRYTAASTLSKVKRGLHRNTIPCQSASSGS